jgi:hypothetical protein
MSDDVSEDEQNDDMNVEGDVSEEEQNGDINGEGDVSEVEENGDMNVDDEDALHVALNSHGYIERGIVLSPEKCKIACDYFKAATNKREGRHIIANGTRRMVTVDPSRTTDSGMLLIIDDVKRNMFECFPNQYRNVESVIIKEIQLIMNQKGFDLDQDEHLDSFYNNLVMTVLLQTGRGDNQKGTLTIMSPKEYMDIYTLSDALKSEHNITQEAWDSMLCVTFESIKNGLSQEGQSKDTLFSFTKQERNIWVSLLHGNGFSSKEGIPFTDSDMQHSRDRNKDDIGAGVIFRSNRSTMLRIVYMLRIVMFEIPTSLNQFPSADENDVDDDTSDNDIWSINRLRPERI